MIPDLRSQRREELVTRLAEWKEPVYRVDQILHWAYERLATGWDSMSNVPRRLRDRLAERYTLRLPEPVKVQGARDSTRKFLWRLHDGAFIESVLIPANPALYGEGSDRHTLCISTQVGCAYGCRFCASGLDGWRRNLNVEEILGQVLAVEVWHRGGQSDLAAAAPAPDSPGVTTSSGSRLVSNVVVMGMGEPLANFEALLKALDILNAPWGGGIGARKITVSTSGLVPQIRALAATPAQFGLAISLHGATDEVRSRLMPINRKYPLADLVAAGETYVREKGRMLTLEYILIEGVNDDLRQVSPLAQIARRLHAKVNLIPYNEVEPFRWRRPSVPRQEAFLAALRRSGVTATLRREKGHDIDAACGQLRMRTLRGKDSEAG